MMTVKRYIRNVGVGVDQLTNAILGGDPDETISSRLGKCKEEGNKFCILVCRVLTKIWVFFGSEKSEEHGHCISVIERDEGKDRIIK